MTEREVLKEWQAALGLAGLESTDWNTATKLGKVGDFTVDYALQILHGYVPPPEHQERIIEACRPLIEERKRRGEIRDL